MPVTLKLITRSPLHIGSGHELESFEYIIHDGFFWRLDINRVTAFLLDEIGEEALEQFSSWIEWKTDRLADARNNREQAEIRRSLTLRTFVRGELGRPDLDARLLQQLQSRSRYAMRTSFSEFRQLVREQLKDPDGRLYIPGSSLKGALRTCLLYQVLVEADEKTHRRWLAELRDSLGRAGRSLNRRERVFFSRWLEEDVFYCGVRKKGKVSWRDAQFDLLKFLRISDSSSVAADEIGVVTDVEIFLPGAEPQPQAPPVEALEAGAELQAQVGFDVSFFREAHRLLARGEKGMGTDIWIGLPEKFQRLYGLTLEEAAAMEAEELERRLLERVRKAARNFGRALKAFEKEWCRRAERGSTLQQARRLQRFYDELPDDCLRLGWGSGFAAVTVYLALREKPAWKEPLQNLLHRLFSLKEREDLLQTFPTSRRMAIDGEGTMVEEPMGWVELEWPWSATEAAATTEEEAAEDESDLWVDQIGPNSQDIIAEVVDNSRAPFTIRIFVRGLENERFPCGGASHRAIEVGQRIRVKVSQWNKKAGRPTMFSVQSIRV
ncbi:CRISPR-associated RAMP protein, Csm5 family (plasmid) [Rhodothermus marinus SG0.5JP17-172]|uniref:type III-A CRISPR-associated RAMP protein Csm5 n=1 Tax=Rhodothermus marinus TaxID=29549 RepID=UPI000223D0EE|nr:type III-A CRISPR-associated RAMP protein Csm5 [Rhodothermus marinus]AEN74744.1 CRISPR-associated RAMP protein, Csm5 family [Rhodothermus marinus SG0.5JP17-172]